MKAGANYVISSENCSRSEEELKRCSSVDGSVNAQQDKGCFTVFKLFIKDALCFNNQKTDILSKSTVKGNKINFSGN